MDQVACLAGLQDVASLTLNNPEPVTDDNSSDDGMDRCFTFEVQETSEMEEGVEYSPGFSVRDAPLLDFTSVYLTYTRLI